MKIENNMVQLPNANDFSSIRHVPLVMDINDNVGKLNSGFLRIDPRFGGIDNGAGGTIYDLKLPNFSTLDSIVVRAVPLATSISNIPVGIINHRGRFISSFRTWSCDNSNLPLTNGLFTSCPIDTDDTFKIWDASGLGQITFSNSSDLDEVNHILIYYHYD